MTHSKNVIMFATADWDAPNWTNKQHMAHHLAQMGYRVLYIESLGLRAPTVNGKDLRRIWQRLQRGLKRPAEVEPRVWLLSPLAIPFKQHWPLTRWINQGWLRLRLRMFMWRHKFAQPLIWTYHPFMLESIKGLAHGPLVYHCVDDLSTVPGIEPAAFNDEEQRLLEQCACVFVTSLPLKEKCQPYNANTHYFGNVADVDHFGKALLPGPIPTDLQAIPAPRIAYIGALYDYKVDFELIHAVAVAQPDWHWVLIGAEREGQHSQSLEQLRSRPNVHLLGHRPYRYLPDYLRGIDVGTQPSLINDYTHAMFPMKYFEYLAAGVPVVATPLAFTRNHRAGLEIAATGTAFADALKKQLQRGKLTPDEAQTFVGENTWSRRLEKMLGILEASLEHCPPQARDKSSS